MSDMVAPSIGTRGAVMTAPNSLLGLHLPCSIEFGIPGKTDSSRRRPGICRLPGDADHTARDASPFSVKRKPRPIVLRENTVVGCRPVSAAGHSIRPRPDRTSCRPE